MRRIMAAADSGFCFGVRQALDKTEEQIAIHRGRKIYTCGPLIHNKLVTDKLERQGVKIVDSLDCLSEGDIVIIRSHGEAESFYQEAEKRKIQLVDATCPFVSKIHTLVREAFLQGKQVVIVGDSSHPEVKGISGWCGNSAVIVDSAGEAERVEEDDLFVVCQTTSKIKTLEEITEVFRRKNKKMIIKNTICSATTDRQNGCIQLAKICDAMVVIGEMCIRDRHRVIIEEMYLDRVTDSIRLYDRWIRCV